MTRAAALRTLCTMLLPDGPPRGAAAHDWTALLRLANEHMLAPALFSTMAHRGHLDMVPPEVRDYLALLHGLNAARNAAIRGQATEIVRALNATGIAPLLLKGCMALFTDVYGDPAARMIGDIDILVPAASLPAALAAMHALGYRETSVYEPGHNAYGELWRPSAPATVDVHVAPVDAPHLFSAAEIWRDAVLLPDPEIDVYAASPTHRVLHCLLHAQIHHLGGYYRGALGLNHVYEVAALARRLGDGIDWPEIAARYGAHRLETALQSFMLAAERLFGLARRLAVAPSEAARNHYRFCLAQIMFPSLERLSTPLGNVRAAFAWHRMRALYGERRGVVPWRLRHLRQYLVKQPVNKGLARVFRTQ